MTRIEEEPPVCQTLIRAESRACRQRQEGDFALSFVMTALTFDENDLAHTFC